MALSFSELQAQLRPEWGIEHDGCGVEFDLLMVPSLTLEQAQMELVTGVHHYEERQLFSLIRLRDPGVRMVYVTSKLLPELVVDAVLELLPGVPTSHARRRLHLFDTDDASVRPLTEKLLERPALLNRIGELLRPGRSFISCFVVTELEKRLSELLQIPLLGTDPSLGYWGSKAGSRELFSRCGVPCPPGTGLFTHLDDLAEATAELWEAHPELRKVVVKLNQGFSGEGNAPLDLEALGLEELGRADRRRRLRAAMEHLPMPARRWRELLAAQGALVEAWLEGGDELHSPSVQGTIRPGGGVEVLSTHEQILGGANGQTYLGCRFPAAEEYRLELMRHGQAVGEALAAGRGPGALRRGFHRPTLRSGWDLQAIEVNLRQGGTTHPYMALRAITTGRPGSQHWPVPLPHGPAAPLPGHRQPLRSPPARADAGGPDRHRGGGRAPLRPRAAERQCVSSAGLPVGVRQARHDLRRPQCRRGRRCV